MTACSHQNARQNARHSAPPRRRALPAALLGLVAALAAGCASNSVDAQWQERGVTPTALAGQRVLVVCEAYDTTVRQLCQDRLADEVSRAGATAVTTTNLTPAETGRPYLDTQLLDAARGANASAVFASGVDVGTRREGSGMSIGIGGFGFGGGGFGGGVGVSAPIGGSAEQSGYVARGRLLQAGDQNRLVWSARASSSPSADVDGQLRDLSRRLVEAAGKAGWF